MFLIAFTVNLLIKICELCHAKSKDQMSSPPTDIHLRILEIHLGINKAKQINYLEVTAIESGKSEKNCSFNFLLSIL